MYKKTTNIKEAIFDAVTNGEYLTDRAIAKICGGEPNWSYIEFHATVTSVKWSGGKTAIDMTIPDAAVSDINDKKTLLSFYVAHFEPDKTQK